MKIKFSLFLFFITLPLFSSFYSSNEIGQKGSSVPSIDSSEWVLEKLDGENRLYHNAIVVETTKYSDGKKERSREGLKETTYFDSEKRIERKIIEENGETREYNYLYNNGLLSGYNYSENGNFVKRVDYTTTSDARLLYYSDGSDGIYLTSDYFVYSSELSPINLTNETTSERGENEWGGYWEERDGIYSLFNEEGRLILERRDNYSTIFSYNSDGSLKEKREEREDGIYITNQDDSTVHYSYSGEKISERVVREDGLIEETRFINGEAKYLFIYDSDKKRIKGAMEL